MKSTQPLRPTRQGRMVREHRQANGLTHADVCRQMKDAIGWKCSPATVANLEVGRVETPRFKVQQGIAAILGLEPKDLWPEA